MVGHDTSELADDAEDRDVGHYRAELGRIVVEEADQTIVVSAPAVFGGHDRAGVPRADEEHASDETFSHDGCLDTRCSDHACYAASGNRSPSRQPSLEGQNGPEPIVLVTRS